MQLAAGEERLLAALAAQNKSIKKDFLGRRIVEKPDKEPEKIAFHSKKNTSRSVVRSATTSVRKGRF